MGLVLHTVPTLTGDEEANKGSGMNLARSNYTAQGVYVVACCRPSWFW
jgi:hypothetical protein